MGAYESGQDFLKSVLDKLPADKQAAAKALFEDPTAKDAVTLAGSGVLARADYSKGMDELRAKTDELNTWYADNKAALDEWVALKPEYEILKKNPADPPKREDPPVDPRKVAEEVLAAQGRSYVDVADWLSDRKIDHFMQFGERLNTRELLDDPRLGKPVAGQPGRVVSLPDLYQEKYGERIAAKQKDAEEKKYNEEVDKRVKERLAQHTPNPFPLRGESSVLDVLNEKDGPSKHTVETAVAEYERLQASRT